MIPCIFGVNAFSVLQLIVSLGIGVFMIVLSYGPLKHAIDWNEKEEIRKNLDTLVWGVYVIIFGWFAWVVLVFLMILRVLYIIIKAVDKLWDEEATE